MTRRLVVVGGGAAGMSAASAARRVDPGLEIVVAEATGWAAWGLCGLPYYLMGLVAEPADLVAYPPDFFRTQRAIDLRLHTRVAEVDADRRTVGLVDAGGTHAELAYDTLVLTTGGDAVRPVELPADGERIFGVRTLEDAQRLRQLLDDGRVRRALVVGASYIGLEMADALAARGCDVVVAEMGEQVLGHLDAPMAEPVEAEVRRRVDLRLGTRVGGARRVDGRVTAQLDGAEESFDVVVLGVGVAPNAALLAGAGAATGHGGGLVVDERQRTTVPHVVAAGDCAEVRHLVTGDLGYVPLGPAANKTGHVAGTVAAGGDATFEGVVGTAAVKVFDLTVARTGLSLTEAQAAGTPAMATDVEHRSQAKYYPGSEPLRLRLVHQPDGRLLGGQIVSRDPAAAKRIDVVATALHAGFDVARVAELDLSYAPPYAPVTEATLVAARSALRHVDDGRASGRHARAGDSASATTTRSTP